jgi:hypothetical protein
VIVTCIRARNLDTRRARKARMRRRKARTRIQARRMMVIIVLLGIFCDAVSLLHHKCNAPDIHLLSVAHNADMGSFRAVIQQEGSGAYCRHSMPVPLLKASILDAELSAEDITSNANNSDDIAHAHVAAELRPGPTIGTKRGCDDILITKDNDAGDTCLLKREY